MMGGREEEVPKQLYRIQLSRKRNKIQFDLVFDCPLKGF